MPDPRQAARAYEQALESGDAARVRALLSKDAQDTYSEQDVKALLQRDGQELRAQAAACADESARVEATAVVRGAGQAELGLTLEEGAFRIDSEAALFPRPATPEAAARALRAALSSGHIERIERALSGQRRAFLEERRAALLESLADLERASIRVSDQSAVIELPDGQVLELVEEGGVWRVEGVP